MDEELVKKIDSNHFAQVYEKLPVVIVRGKEAIVWDINGKEYIDCNSGYGVAIVGHCNPRIIKAIFDQSEKLITCHGSLYNDARAEFLEKLTSLTPKGLDKAYLCNSGAEANECALKLARKYTGKSEIISLTGSYHGKTLGSLSVTWDKKYRDSFQPLIPGVRFALYGNSEKIKEAITEKTAAIIMEPIQGESGIHLPPDGFLEEVRRICDERNILLIFDEVQSGLGRTGKMWASEHWKVTPDVMCLAKGLAGGLPFGATLAKNEIMSSLKVGDHSTTFGGNPLCCAAAKATLDYIVDENLPDRAATLGNFFKQELNNIKENSRIVRDVRGLGLMLAMELRFDIKNVLFRGIEKGVIMLYSGRNILRFLPPLVINEDQIKKVARILNQLVIDEEQLKMNP